MAKTDPAVKQDSAARLIDSIEVVEKSSLEAVRKFVDTVDGVFPDVGGDGPRRKIIDSAFKMVEQLVGTTNQFAQSIVMTTEHAMDELNKSQSSPKA